MPSILNVLIGVNALISLSLSAINRTATLCTRPALRLFLILILRHKTGLNSKPTIRSRIRLACWAFTRFISTVRGFSTASLYRRLSDLMKNNPFGCFWDQAQYFTQMPADGFSFTVLIRCQPYFI